MLESGLLSLSIHEELTFEGTEIAIHPDLFTEPGASTTGSISVSSSRHSVLNRSGSGTMSLASLTTAPASGSLLPTSDGNQTQSHSPAIHDHKHSSTLHYESHLPSVAESNSIGSNPRRLEVGNIIEIKVWDPKSSAQLNSTKRRSLPPSSRVSPESNSAITEWLKGSPSEPTTSNDPKEPANSSLAQNPATSRTLDALISPRITRGKQNQKRAEAPDNDALLSDSNAESNKKDTIKALPLPKSPRQESPVVSERKGSQASNTRIRLGASETQRQGKPPLIQKRTAANVLSSTVPTADLRASAPKLQKPTHFRDISDVTMDTSLAPPVACNDGELGVPSMDSQDELTAEDNVFAKIASTHTLRTSFVMLVTGKTLTSLKGQSRSQISILRQIADLFQLSPFDMVTINRIEKNAEPSVLEAVSADFVFCTIKDQFISRGYMHSFQKSLIGRWIYEGVRLSDSARGIKAHAREIRHADNLVKSGIITEDTKITFRSRSTRIIWLVQISSEMWDYSNPYELDGERKEESSCELVFDKFVRFMYKLFKKWKELEVTHSLTVVFFSRTLVSNHKGAPLKDDRLSKDVYGRCYEDRYKTIVDNETPSDWDSLIVRVKRAFVRYPFDAEWDLSEDNYRRPSTAMQGNLLEAINVTLNLLQFHFLDRDLHRTGNSVVVVSPECGVFEVDRTLAGITYQRMMDNGIGSDMVCLGLPPLHVAPFFLYNNFLGSDKDRGEGDTHPKDAHSEVPHWMHLSFVRYDGDPRNPASTSSMEQAAPASPCKSETLVDGLAIAPNGFLIPEVSVDPRTTDAALLTSFTAHNSSSSSGITKSQNQQRQLISGRDFKDIIDACRPRTSTYILPSPLVILLRIRKKENGNGTSAGFKTEDPIKLIRNPNAASSQERLHLREWGTVDFDDVDGPMSFPAAGARLVSNGAKSPTPGSEVFEQSGVSAKSSPSSSLASQLFGRSVERAAVSFSSSIGGGHGLQIQRSPSFEFDVEPFADDEPCAETAILRKVMSDHDNKLASQGSSNARPALDLSGFVSSIVETPNEDSSVEPPAASSLSGNETGGGLVAALSRYKTSESSFSSNDLLLAKTTIPTTGKIGGASCLGTVSESGSRPLSYSSFVGMRVGSEPPGHVPLLPAQTMQALVRSQQQMMVPGTSGVEQRTVHMTRSISMLPSARSVLERLAQDATSDVIGSPLRLTSATGLSLLTLPTNNAQTPKTRTRGSKNMKKSVVNPFRQQDEDDELAKKSHNRRRWSHVFPLGELEFKRHAGPLWNSLCQPAILPLTIDYFPTPQEMNDTKVYRYNHYRLTLQGMEQTHYSSHRELLMEMVRQRITQDFQMVPPSVLSASNAVCEGDIQRTLSMGHRIHVLTYDSQSDTIDVKIITATPTEEDKKPITYCYYMYSQFTNSFQRVVQTFEKYSEEYRWNSMDHVILEDIDMELSMPLRCRRLQFELIPPKLDNDDGVIELEYVDKFKRLLEYFEKLREKDQPSLEDDLKVKFLTRTDEGSDRFDVRNERLGTTDKMKRFKIRLCKGTTVGYEWVEISIDSVFDTTRTFRIMFNWLVASTSKIEAQVQLVQRRCIQYGLELISSPQACISSDLFLNPFAIPEIFCIRRLGKVAEITNWLLKEDFIDDGVHMTDPSYLGAIENSQEFSFPLNRRTNRIRSVACRQFLHRVTSAVFVRMIVDEKGLVILAVIMNKRRIRDKSFMDTAISLVDRIQGFVDTVVHCSALKQCDAKSCDSHQRF